MSLVSIRAALENGLDGVSSNFPTAYDNVDFEPTVGTAFQRAFLITAEPDNPTMDDSHYREQGIFQVSLYYPIKAGSGAAMTRAELIKSTFYRGASFTYDGVVVRIERTPEVSQGFIDDDNRFVVPVRIRWFADIFR